MRMVAFTLFLILGLPMTGYAEVHALHGRLVMYREMDGNSLPLAEADFVKLVSGNFALAPVRANLVRLVFNAEGSDRVTSHDVRLLRGQTGPQATGVVGDDWMDLPPPVAAEYYEYRCWTQCDERTYEEAAHKLTNLFQGSVSRLTIVRFVTHYSTFGSTGYDFVIPRWQNGSDVTGMVIDSDPNPCPPCTDAW